MKPSKTPDERNKDVLPFVKLICEHVELGIVSAVKVIDYKNAHPRFRQTFGTDPLYFAFQRAIFGILDHWVAPDKYDVGLILDDEEAKSIECYRFLKKLKLSSERVRKQVTSICFTDDKTSVQDQAADLFCYLSRIDLEWTFLNKPHPFRLLCEPLRSKYPGRRLNTAGGLFEETYLAEFLDSAIRMEQEAKKANGKNG